MSAFDDPIGAVLIILALMGASGVLFSLLCAATALCERAERWWRSRGVIGAWVDDPAAECRRFADDWRYEFECGPLPGFLRQQAD
jgi:hypothetical protein